MTRATKITRLGIGFAIVLMLAEVGFRMPPLADHTEEPNLYYTPGVRSRIKALTAACDAGPLDLLFVGNSVAATNIDPSVLAVSSSNDAGLEVESFVLGLPGLTIDPLRVQLERLWLPICTPQVVVQVVRLSDFADPVPAQDSELIRGRIERRWFDDTPLSRIELFMLNHSALIRHAGSAFEVVTTPPDPSTDASGFSIDDAGHQPRSGLLRENLLTYGDATPGAGLAAQGYRTALDPATYRVGLEQLEATLDLVQSHGATYVLLNMPEHPDKYLAAPDGEERYESYLAALRTFAHENGIVFIDPSEGSLETWSNDQLFFDFHHLNNDGASLMSQEIARRLIDSGIVAGHNDTGDDH